MCGHDGVPAPLWRQKPTPFRPEFENCSSANERLGGGQLTDPIPPFFYHPQCSLSQLRGNGVRASLCPPLMLHDIAVLGLELARPDTLILSVSAIIWQILAAPVPNPGFCGCCFPGSPLATIELSPVATVISVSFCLVHPRRLNVRHALWASERFKHSSSVRRTVVSLVPKA